MTETRGRSLSLMDGADAEPASSRDPSAFFLTPHGAELSCSRGRASLIGRVDGGAFEEMEIPDPPRAAPHP